MSGKRQDPLLAEKPGHAECLLGNEAVVRGALEAGVAFASGYPGTPSSEVTDSLARVAKAANIVFEYSVNEKVALEMAFAASIAGARAICAMKHLGLMYAGDPLSTIPYVGTVGGLVIVSAGDPSCRTSPNEQDQRLLAPMLHLPTLDPSTPLEAYEMTRFAFELSERSRLPVILRSTTRVCHSREVIPYGELMKPKVTGFVRDPERFVPVPVHARNLRRDLTRRVAQAQRLMEESRFFTKTAHHKLAIVASGAPAATCDDILAESGIDDQVMLVTIGCVYPLPENRLVEAMQGVERALVVEELSPYLEDALRSLCSKHDLHVEILGKRTDHFPVEFEYSPELIHSAIYAALGIGSEPAAPAVDPDVVARPPTLCPGCPHRPAQFAARTVFGEEALFFNDIGCYTLGFGPPLEAADSLLCMGAGFSLAAGVSRVTGQRTVGILGDSTFFHSGMPALLNAIKENVNMVAIILDNHVTAMTGFQESPGVSFNEHEPARTVDIEATVRALGAGHVETFDPYDLPAAISAFERARDASGVSVVIARRSCPGYIARETHKPYKIGTYAIDHNACRTCGRESDGLRCETCISLSYERHLAHSRALETTQDDLPQPSLAPCSVRCPVDLCVQGYVGHIAAGRYREAFDLIMERLPLPDSVCRVCHQPCEGECVRVTMDEAVSIKELKRFAVDWAAAEQIPYSPERDEPSGKKMAVIGAGPAGLAAAHDLFLRGHEVTLFEAAEKPGGLLRSGIPRYRLPLAALERDVERITSMGVTLVCQQALGRDFTLGSLLDDGFAAVFIAVGTPKGVKLELPEQGETELPPVEDALAYLWAEEPPSGADGEELVVIGGGNAAIDAARVALRRGVRQATVVYRRAREEMPAMAEELDAAVAEGVALVIQTQPIELVSGGVKVITTRPGELDDSGRRRPVPVAGTERVIRADRLIAALGQRPDQVLIENMGAELEWAKNGSLAVDPQTLRTSHPKVFAGGDIIDGPKTVIDAIATGQRAAWGMDLSVRGPALANRRPAPRPTRKSTIPYPKKVKRADAIPRARAPQLPTEERRQNFAEVVQPLNEVDARREGSRCLVCGQCGNCRICLDLFGCPAFYVKDGRIHIDAVLCMGCGVCAAICPNGAIRRVDDTKPLRRSLMPSAGPVESWDEEIK